MVKLMLCDCGSSQPLDREAIASATGFHCSKVHTALCTKEIDLAAAAIAEGDIIVACGQESEAFIALAEEIDADIPHLVDIRDRAGWSDQAAAATPKIAALLAEATFRREPEKTIDVESEGICLLIGDADAVLPAAEQLSGLLSITCLIPEPSEITPKPLRTFDVVAGHVRQTGGAFGGFSVTIDEFRELVPSGRGPLGFSDPKDGARSECDLIIDLSGRAPLFPSPEKREGYLRADPRDPIAVQRALLSASQLVGTFEKTLHVAVEPSLCAHKRAEQVGCTRCLDLCPTGAILPDGDHVTIDPMICAGCGACSSVCPSGAVTFDAPSVGDTFGVVRRMAEAYLSAGGTLPRLLVHDEVHGRDLIAMAARFGRGLPADVLPLAMPTVGAFGHAEMMGALASGFAGIRILLAPRTDPDALMRERDLARALLAGLGRDPDSVNVLELNDPDALSEALYDRRSSWAPTAPILPLGPRRDVTRLAARALDLQSQPSPIPLPDGAPYGAVLVDAAKCTLCLSCVGLCPSGALDDNADAPELRFREDACLQCGICATICPENAIALEPRLDASDDALRLRVLKTEEPYACIECGSLFGVKSTIEKIVEKLEGHHAMFTNSDNTRLIRMCDDCRVKAQFHSEGSPFEGGARPRVRTTDDYLDD